MQSLVFDKLILMTKLRVCVERGERLSRKAYSKLFGTTPNVLVIDNLQQWQDWTWHFIIIDNDHLSGSLASGINEPYPSRRRAFRAESAVLPHAHLRLLITSVPLLEHSIIEPQWIALRVSEKAKLTAVNVRA